MFGSFSKLARKPCSRASSSSELPGSVIAMKWLPSRTSEWKYSNSDSVSIVPPDLVETTNSVRSRSICSRTARIAAGSVESSTCSASAPSVAPKVRQSTSGARLEPPIPSSTASVRPSAAQPRANSTSSSARSSIASEIVSQPRRSPISGDARDRPTATRPWPTRGARRRSSTAVATRAATALESSPSIDGGDRRRAPGEDRLARALDPGQQLVHRRDERLDALARAASSVTSSMSMPAAASARELGRRVAPRAVGLDLAALGDGQQRLQRHRVDGVGRDQPVDVLRLGVGGVLGPGRGPQRPLHRARPAARSAAKRSPRKICSIARIGGARVGERGGPGEVAAPERLEALVDLGVHARDEEARDRMRRRARAPRPARRSRPRM